MEVKAELDVIDARLQAVQDQAADSWAMLNQMYGYLQAMNGEIERLHKRLDEYEPHAKRLIDNPIARMLRGRVGTIGGSSGA